MFKGGTEINYPATPPAPSTADAINAWVQSMPQVYQTQMQYAPQQAAQEVALAQQYALPMAQAYKTAQEAMYPTTTALQEGMAGQATAGMNATSMPDWMKNQYQADINANLGSNVGSPMGADYTSRAMQKQLFEQQKYYRDLGLSLSGRQPLSQPQTPQTANYMQGFTPQSNMNYMASNYSQYARPFGSQRSNGVSLGFLGNWGVA